MIGGKVRTEVGAKRQFSCVASAGVLQRPWVLGEAEQVDAGKAN